MPFNERSRLDASQVEDRRGRRMGTTMAIGGGGIGIVVLLLALVFGVNPSDLQGVLGQTDAQSQASEPSAAGGEDMASLAEVCRTGADANARQDCRVVGYVNSIQAFWTEEFARRGSEYVPAKTVLYSESTNAACGAAYAAMGPFYCPADQSVYLDLAFFEQLQTKFGAQGGPFAEAYVLAHEYGHHIQDLAGALNQLASSGATGPRSVAVQVELQADCLAGVWAHNATATGYLTEITEEDVVQALDAAAAVGDDQIQRETTGYVSPETWTHGSSAQRQAALKLGMTTGDLASCSAQ